MNKNFFTILLGILFLQLFSFTSQMDIDDIFLLMDSEYADGLSNENRILLLKNSELIV